MQDLKSLRRDCAHRRSEYLHARDLFAQVRPLPVDPTALRDELAFAALAYYAAHGALHDAFRGRRVPSRPN